MSNLNKIILLALIICLVWLTAEAAKGPILVNVDVSPGAWKAIRLKNLPKDAVIALEVKSDGVITVMLVGAVDYQRFPNPQRPLFIGVVEKKLSFSVSIPESGHYYIVLDNRTGNQQRAITVTAAAAHGQLNQIKAASRILGQFEQQLHQVFVFKSFPVGVEQCRSSKPFGESPGILLCAGYVQKLFELLGDEEKSKDALSFSIFHEVSHVLLTQWNHPLSNKKELADEFATVLMVMLAQTKRLSANAENFARNPPISKTLKQTLQDDRHPLTVQRAKKILAWLRDRRVVLKWQKFLVPHMQTVLLKRLQQHPTEWTDLALVEKELALRDKKLL